MANTQPNLVVGEVPPGLEVLAELPKLAIETAKNFGRTVIELLDLDVDSTATSFDVSVAHLAR